MGNSRLGKLLCCPAQRGQEPVEGMDFLPSDSRESFCEALGGE